MKTKTKHLKDDCTAAHMTFGNVCMNCGMNNKPQQAKREERKADHMPTPLKFQISNDQQACITANGVVIAHIKDYAQEEGRFIVRAVNAHEELIELLKDIQGVDYHTRMLSFDQRARLEKAIAKAEGRV
jgi:hypothetical protein